MPTSTETSAAQGPQIIVDCYMLRVEEEAQTSKGNNILQNLAVTLNPGGFTAFRGRLGGSGANVPGPGSSQNQNAALLVPDSGFKANQAVPANTGANSVLNPSTTTMNLYNKGTLTGSIFASGITWAGLTYSLNIANAIDMRTEVVSRPSLMTFLQKQSVFFSGDELVIGLSGQYGGTLTKYPIGVTLIVTPESLDGDLLTLNITIEGSLLTSPNPNLQQTVTVGKTRVDTYAKVRLGETLMLGGIYERQEILSKDGFPGLRDIPIAQYFFSNESTLSSRRSIVFMLTPRSPDLVKSAVNRAMSRDCKQPHLAELTSRNPDWFASSPNLVPLFSYLSKDPVIYYEFRSGDILPPSWGWEPTFEDKLALLSEFLYY
jgi:general secretion pathway protein D